MPVALCKELARLLEAARSLARADLWLGVGVLGVVFESGKKRMWVSLEE